MPSKAPARSVHLDYGTEGLRLDITGLNATILRPGFVEGLPNERTAFSDALNRPIGSASLRDIVGPADTLAVAVPDITRAMPSSRLLPWLFEELPHVDPGSVTILIGTGTHRANTREELSQMLGEAVVDRYIVVNHYSRDPATMKRAGTSTFGYEVFFNRHYVEADRRILMGFIEPHFMAGFSGGYKAVFPGLANLEAILRYHGYGNIAHPRSTWGILQGNPTQAHVRAGGSLLPVDFLINVTLNNRREITRFFCGDVVEAHEVGSAFSRETAMAGVDEAYPVVVTTNSGYPLDLNLYQAVKGMTAADAITRPGGLIVTAARCNDGFPEHGAFKRQLLRYASADEALTDISRPDFSEIDQWQTQKLLQICRSKRVQLFSELDPAVVRKAHIEPVDDVREAIDRELARLGQPDAPVAILPEGPLTIPYVKGR